MSRAENLPLYLQIYQFTTELYRLKTKLPVILRHDLGKAAFETSLRMIKCVVTANRSAEKVLSLDELLTEIELQWVYVRLLFDLKAISSAEFKALSTRLAEIEKQGRAWFNWQNGVQSRSPKPKGGNRKTPDHCSHLEN